MASRRNYSDGATRPGKKCDDIFSRLDTMHERDGQTDRRTDTERQHRPRLRIASCSKKLLTINEHQFEKAMPEKVVSGEFIYVRTSDRMDERISGTRKCLGVGFPRFGVVDI